MWSVSLDLLIQIGSYDYYLRHKTWQTLIIQLNVNETQNVNILKKFINNTM